MDLNFTAEEEAFRQEVRAFFAQSLPSRFAQRTAAGLALSKPEQLEWQAILNRFKRHVEGLGISGQRIESLIDTPSGAMP